MTLEAATVAATWGQWLVVWDTSFVCHIQYLCKTIFRQASRLEKAHGGTSWKFVGIRSESSGRGPGLLTSCFGGRTSAASFSEVASEASELLSPPEVFPFGSLPQHCHSMRRTHVPTLAMTFSNKFGAIPTLAVLQHGCHASIHKNRCPHPERWDTLSLCARHSERTRTSLGPCVITEEVVRF